MNKQITFSYKGKEYTLEYTKDTVRQMEKNGLHINDLDNEPMTLYDLFLGAFLKNHPTMKREKASEILDQFKDKQGLHQHLISMFLEPVHALMDDEGNLEWTPNWQTEEEDE